MTFKSIARTDVGNARDHNEDSVCTVSFDAGTLLAITDGMGGHTAGDVASKTALEAFEDYLHDTDLTDAARALRDGVSRANEAVREVASEEGREGMGTTLVAALVTRDGVTVANVGDSRAYEVLDWGTEQITVDQSLVRKLVEQGTISEADMDDHPQRHVLTQALGTEETVEPDIYERPLEGTLLLCSDGLTEEVSDSRIHEIVTTDSSLTAVADRLIERANENGGSDNISVALGKRT